MESKNFPQLPSAVWWVLRDAFKRTIPSKVTEGYLASILNVKETAARAYLRELKIIGLVKDDGSPSDAVVQWRDDETYAPAAKKLFEQIYPDELRASAPPPNPDRQRVIRWFMQSGRMGEGAAGNKAAFYTLLASGELQKEIAVNKQVSPKKQNQKQAIERPTRSDSDKTENKSGDTHTRTQVEPNIQLNVQIHISADATKDQIDAIFSSMATHLRR